MYAIDGSLTEASACEQLIWRPVPFAKCARNGLARNATTKQCTSGKAMMMGQFQQDYYLYMTHFRYLRRPGIYVDVAVHEPMEFSNTWFFDSCLHWSGICIDGNPYYTILAKKQRSCEVVSNCMSDDDMEQVKFVFAEGRGGIERTNKNMGELQGRLKRMHNGSVEIRCMKMRKVLEEKKITTIDYLSVDVEGHELRVLKGVDWGKVRVNVMTVEGNEDAEEIRRLMKERGYEEHVYPTSRTAGEKPSMGRDQVFVHRDVTWGRPV